MDIFKLPKCMLQRTSLTINYLLGFVSCFCKLADAARCCQTEKTVGRTEESGVAVNSKWRVKSARTVVVSFFGITWSKFIVLRMVSMTVICPRAWTSNSDNKRFDITQAMPWAETKSRWPFAGQSHGYDNYQGVQLSTYSNFLWLLDYPFLEWLCWPLWHQCRFTQTQNDMNNKSHNCPGKRCVSHLKKCECSCIYLNEWVE